MSGHVVSPAMSDLVARVEDSRAVRKIVDSYGRTWGWQWRRHFGDLARFPLSSMAGRLMTEGDGVLDGFNKPRHYAELFLGQGLEFAVALKHVPIRHREMAWVHYAVEIPRRSKWTQMKLDESAYWERVTRMQIVMIGALCLDE